MAAVWFTRIYNYSKHTLTLYQNDGTWHPVIAGKQYQLDEPITLPPYHEEQRIPLPITIPGIGNELVIPAGPGLLECQYFFVGWFGFNCRTLLRGPKDTLEMTVSSKAVSGNDFFRVFDGRRNEILSVEMGPGGTGAIASLDLHLIIGSDGNVRITIASAYGVGQDLIEKANQLFDASVGVLGKGLGTLLEGAAKELFEDDSKTDKKGLGSEPTKPAEATPAPVPVLFPDGIPNIEEIRRIFPG